MKNIKRFSLALLFAGVMVSWSGCGSSSSTSSFEAEISSSDGSKYRCTSEDAYNMCKNGDCTQCTQLSAADHPVVEGNCTVVDNNVTVKPGEQCVDNGYTVECMDNGGVHLFKAGKDIKSGTTVNDHGRIYSCDTN